MLFRSTPLCNHSALIELLLRLQLLKQIERALVMGLSAA